MEDSDPDRFLIVTADDFGRHVSVNAAVERAHRNGVLTAASLMVAEPAAGDAVQRARLLPTLRIGLHLALADGCATLAPHLIPELLGPDARMDATLWRKSLRFFANPRVRAQMEAELRAQFEAFGATELELDHVNVHKQLHLHPSVLSAILRVGADFRMPAMRLPVEPLWFARQSGWAATTSAVAQRPLIYLMKQRLRAAGVRYNDQLFGLAATGSMDQTKFLTALAALPAGVSEIYCHPALQPASVLGTPAGYQHERELHALMNLRVKTKLVSECISTGGFRDAFPAMRRAL